MMDYSFQKSVTGFVFNFVFGPFGDCLFFDAFEAGYEFNQKWNLFRVAHSHVLKEKYSDGS